MRALSVVLLAALSAPAFGQYAYYFTDPMQSLQTADWTTSGNPQFTNAYGYWAAYGDATNADSTMLSTLPVQGPSTTNYEVRVTLRFPLGLSYGGGVTLLLRASGPLGNNGPAAGYYVMLSCNATGAGYITVEKWTNPNTVTVLWSGGTSSCSDGMTFRAAITNNNQIISFMNDSFANWVQDTSSTPITTGAPGLILPGSSAGFPGSVITQVQLGPDDAVNPGPIPYGGLTYAVYSNHVDFQWQAVPDDPNGTGVCLYQFLRDDNWAFNTDGSLNWSDTTVQPGMEYTYTFIAYDGFFNSVQQSVTITIPPLPGTPPTPPDGHRVGVRSTGAYWGASNEQIDVMSGNVNLTIPLLKPQARTGWGVGFSLSYNSQNWRQDWAGLWNLGEDVGFGYGWKLLAGSITPIWGDQNTLAYYLYTDATGAEYRLNQNNNGIWTSLESIYVTLDTTVSPNVLHFRDGSFWALGCTSEGSEPDLGTMYPTTMEDTNGNTIIITYMAGAGLSGTNSSARITQIQDVRGYYYFTYSGTHLTQIRSEVQTGESYTFSYQNNLTLQSPFNGASTPYNVSLLTQVNVTSTGQQYALSYTSDNSGTLKNVTLPNGGFLGYTYQQVNYGNGASFFEVSYRQLSTDDVNYLNYPFNYGTAGYNTNTSTMITDASNNGQKNWTFSQSGANVGMATQYQGIQVSGNLVKTQNSFTWTQDNLGNLYIGSTISTLDPGQSYQAQSRTDQVVDIYGNVLKTIQFDYNNLSTPARVTVYSYLNSSAYLSRYIYNRLSSVSVGIGNQNVTAIAGNAYDGQYLQAVPSGVPNWDTSYTNVTARGNVTSWNNGTDSGSNTYDQSGNTLTASKDGVTTTVTPGSQNFYAAPSQISVGGMTTALSWNGALGLTGVTGPNGDTATASYDPTSGRPTSTTSPFGATTNYGYGNYSSGNPAYVETQTNTRYTKQLLDGFGRTITSYAGDNPSAWQSQTDTVYGPCACSPIGKMMKQSMPHAPSLPQSQWAWTQYTYDATGRTLNVLAPDGYSTTSYVYQGNSVKVTDPAGKWKLFTMGVFGHLTSVDEPNPSGSSPPPQPVSPPTFSLAPGNYSGSQTVTLATSTSGATIRYTTNGAMPSETSGTVYSGAIALSSTTTINAIAYAGGMADSAISTGTFTITSGGSGGGATWYNSSWNYRKQITISAGQVAGSLSNFPVLISLPSDSNLANGGAQTNGNDILFTDSSGTNKLNHEIETFVSSTGQLVAWVQVPSLSSSSNTTLYMYYGNSTASSQQSATAVWNSGYQLVYHLNQGGVATTTDSTANGNNGTNTSTASASGPTGGATSFNGTTAQVSIPHTSSLAVWTGANLTAELWFYLNATTNYATLIDSTHRNFSLFVENGNFYVGIGQQSNGFNCGSFSTSTWYQFTLVRNGLSGNSVTCYLNGVAQNSFSLPSESDTSEPELLAANPSGGGTFLNGSEGELRISNIALAPSWILTEYNNQNSPSTFFSLSSQQTQSGGGSGGSWYNGAWSYRKPITISSSQIAGTLTNFPVLVSESDSNLSAYAQSSGNDILFTASDGMTKLNHEIESYSNGNIVAWVQMPTLSTSNNVIYMYYGNSSAANQQNPTAAWDSNFMAVYHFSNNGSFSPNDSTWNQNNGVNNSVSATSGQVGSGASFNGSSSYLTIGDSASLQVDGLITMSAWANVSSFPPPNTNDNSNTWAYIIGKGYDNTSEGYYFRLNAQNTSYTQLNAGSYTNPNNYQVLWPIAGWNTNTWHHVVSTYDGTAWRLYMDGVLEASTNQTTGAIPSNPGAYIGAQNVAGSMLRFWNGSLDEVRISNIARSAAWIKTEFNNQSAPLTFLSYGVQQNLTGGSYYPPAVGMPTLEPAPGSYTSPVSVVLTSATPGATIHYTIDGSTPSETSGLVYAAPFVVSGSTTVKAMAYEPGLADSEITSVSYTITALASGGDYMTYYTYDAWDNLVSVTMPRPTGTQTRSFTYSGKQLLTTTNPENGTVTYTYNQYQKVATKTDAKGQVMAYTYDSLARLTEVQKYPNGSNNPEDQCQRELYYYDNSAFTGNYSQYPTGRLTGIQYYAPSNGIANTGLCATTIQEQYSYNQGGAKISKGMLLTRNLQWQNLNNGISSGPVTADLESSYTYDNEGRMLTEQYPNSNSGGTAGPNISYAYDTMGRVNTMTDVTNSVNVITATTYDAGNRLTNIAGSAYAESRSYNAMGQLVSLANNSVSIAYNYSATQNNGKITSQADYMSGEQVVYTYDSLNRLASATATSNSWGQSYGYDGFGNLTTQTVTAGSAPPLSLTYDVHNHPSDTCADANGNLSAYVGAGSTSGTCGGYPGGGLVYDVKNRIVSVGDINQLYGTSTNYAYAPDNKRVWRGTSQYNSSTDSYMLTVDEITFWSVSGQKLATYTLYGDPTQVYANQSVAFTWSLATSNYYFGRKLIKNSQGYVGTNRLGSVGNFYPWGQEKPSATTNGTEKFTGYFRDAETTLDYAISRYHQPGMGRFLTPDASRKSGKPSIPGSWNRYAYALGDPVKYNDPRGREVCDPDEGDECPDYCDAGYYWDEDSEDCEPEGGGGGGSPSPSEPNCASAFVNQLTNAPNYDVLYRVLNENSYGLGSTNLTNEDLYIVSVLQNRTQSAAGTLGNGQDSTNINNQAKYAGNPSSLNYNYANLSNLISSKYNLSLDSTGCQSFLQDIATAQQAVQQVLSAGSVNTSVFFWYTAGYTSLPSYVGAMITTINNTSFYGLP